MKFENFIKTGQVKKAATDIPLVKSLISTSDKDLLFLQASEINENSARKIMSNYYDLLRSILEAICSINGFKVYSHEAFTYFLKEKNEGLIAMKFDKFRKIRNGINYYGKEISIEEVQENKEDILKIIEDLKNKYLKDFI
jgi:hypothetical protein